MIFLSILGTEAMAVVNPLLAMIQHGPQPDRVVLLATPYVRKRKGDQWEAVVRHIAPKLESCGCPAQVELLPISSSLDADSHGPPAQEIVANLLKDSAQIAFNLAGGLNFMVAACLRVLIGKSGMFIYPEQRRVYFIEAGGPKRFSIGVWPLPPAEDVLALQGVPHEVSPSSRAARIQEIFQLCGVELPTGQVRAIKIWGMDFDHFFNDSGTMRFVKVMQGKAATREAFRRLVAHVNDRDSYNDLYHKSIAVITDNIAFADRVKKESLRNLYLLMDDGRQYRDAELRRAMRRFLGFTYDPTQPAAKPAPEVDPDAGHLRSALITTLSSDCVPSLVAAWSALPEHLVLLYTPEDAVVMGYKQAFAAHRHLLGVKALSFVPVSYLGHECLDLKRPAADVVAANVSPGTKGHTAMLTLWAIANGADIHTLDGNSLFRFNDHARTPLRGPQPTTVLELSGHAILGQGCRKKDLEERHGIFDLITRVLELAQAAGQPASGKYLKDLFYQDTYIDGVEVTLRGAMSARLAVIDFHEPGKTATFPLAKGEWFENYVGYRLLTTGVDDVQIRLQTDWSEDVHAVFKKSKTPDFHMTDIDVVARFNGSYVVIECKSGALDHISVNKTAREVKAVAGLFGRFARPMVCLLKYDGDNYVHKEGVQVFGYKTLIDAHALQQLIQTTIGAKRTTTVSV